MRSEYNVSFMAKDSTSHYASCGEAPTLNSWHYHGYYELHYFKGVKGTSWIGDYAGTIETIALFLVPPNMPHKWEISGHSESGHEADESMILIPEDVLLESHLQFPEMKEVQEFMDSAVYGLEYTEDTDALETAKLMTTLDTLSGFARLGHFFAILDKLMTCPFKTLSSSAKPSTQELIQKASLNRALYHIKNHFTESINLNSVASIANMSPTHFCRAFKKVHQIGFVDYVNKLRIEQACRMLETTNEPISSIAYECGYSNISSFNRNFKAHTALSPTVFRRKKEAFKPGEHTENSPPFGCP